MRQTDVMPRILALTLVAGLALTLGACGGGDDSAEDPVPTTSFPPPSPTNTGPLPPDLTKDPDGGETVTVSGRVSLGVEPGCTLLESNGRLYLLLGADVADVEEGDGVRVTGTTAPT